MPGAPIKRRMVKELQRRADLESTPEEPVTALDIVCQWVASGSTISDLARDICKTTGQAASIGVLSSWANSTIEGKQGLAAARVIASYLLVEEGGEILDTADETREAIAKAKARADWKRFQAASFNKPQFGADQPQVNVAISLPGLHLEALRRRAIEAKTPPILPAGEDVELVRD